MAARHAGGSDSSTDNCKSGVRIDQFFSDYGLGIVALLSGHSPRSRHSRIFSIRGLSTSDCGILARNSLNCAARVRDTRDKFHHQATMKPCYRFGVVRRYTFTLMFPNVISFSHFGLRDCIVFTHNIANLLQKCNLEMKEFHSPKGKC